MRASLFTLAIASTPLLASALGACSSDEKKSCADYAPPAAFDPSTPTVSFSKDVMPLFAQSCAFSSCHGSVAGGANGVYLGGADPAKVHEALVNVRAPELPTMSFVEPGKPGESFLMHKLDGSLCGLEARCANADCGQSMPRNDELLPVEMRDVVRRWIAQGAKND